MARTRTGTTQSPIPRHVHQSACVGFGRNGRRAIAALSLLRDLVSAENASRLQNSPGGAAPSSAPAISPPSSAGRAVAERGAPRRKAGRGSSRREGSARPEWRGPATPSQRRAGSTCTAPGAEGSARSGAGWEPPGATTTTDLERGPRAEAGRGVFAAPSLESASSAPNGESWCPYGGLPSGSETFSSKYPGEKSIGQTSMLSAYRRNLTKGASESGLSVRAYS